MTSNADLMRCWFQQVWNEGRMETIDQLLAPDALVCGLGEQGQAVRGPKAFSTFVATMRSSFPDVKVQVEQVITEGEWSAARFTVTMTYTGGGMGFPANGKKATVEGMAMGRIVGGRIVQAWNVWDQRALLRQLGAEDHTRLLK